MLLLDILGVYDKVFYPRLLYNLRKRGIDTSITSWIELFLSNRTTTLKTSKYIILLTPINTGIPQGLPLLSILYLFYNSDLIDRYNIAERLNTVAIGFVDDIGLLTVGNTTEEICENLRKIYKEIYIL